MFTLPSILTKIKSYWRKLKFLCLYLIVLVFCFILQQLLIEIINKLTYNILNNDKSVSYIFK